MFSSPFLISLMGSSLNSVLPSEFRSCRGFWGCSTRGSCEGGRSCRWRLGYPNRSGSWKRNTKAGPIQHAWKKYGDTNTLRVQGWHCLIANFQDGQETPKEQIPPVSWHNHSKSCARNFKPYIFTWSIIRVPNNSGYPSWSSSCPCGAGTSCSSSCPCGARTSRSSSCPCGAGSSCSSPAWRLCRSCILLSFVYI